MSLKKMLDDHGFGKQPDWNKELYSWCQDWVNELKSATDQLRPSIKREGNIIIEVEKSVGTNMLPFICEVSFDKNELGEETFKMEFANGIKNLIHYHELDKKKRFRWLIEEKTGPQVLNKEFVICEIYNVFEKWLEAKKDNKISF
jgi:hypothetical protein